MKIVMNIPDYMYDDMKKNFNYGYIIDRYISSIANGLRHCVPLPENHGKLIDADKVIKNAIKWGQDNPDPYIQRRNSDIIEILNAEEAVIEADKKI